MRNWYLIQAAAGDKPATISIHDEIGYWGVNAKQFIADLRAIEGDTINLEINSPGGSVTDAVAMFSALRASGKTINVKVLGIAASAASYIAMAGDKIVMPANTFMMVHNPLSYAYGNADDMREVADLLEKVGGSLLATYVKRSGKPEAEVKALLDAESYLTAAECLELGLCDEVIDEITAVASFDPDMLPEHIKALFAKKPPVAAAPAPAAAPAAAPATQPVVDTAPLADQITALADGAGFAQHSADWSLKFTKIEDVQAAIAAAREIKSLCAVAKKPESADAFIKASKSVADVRAELLAALAVTDENTHVDPTNTNSNQPTNDAGPSAVTTAGIWAKRRSATAI